VCGDQGSEGPPRAHRTATDTCSVAMRASTKIFCQAVLWGFPQKTKKTLRAITDLAAPPRPSVPRSGRGKRWCVWCRISAAVRRSAMWEAGFQGCLQNRYIHTLNAVTTTVPTPARATRLTFAKPLWRARYSQLEDQLFRSSGAAARGQCRSAPSSGPC
jgi:hypothetical protein